MKAPISYRGHIPFFCAKTESDFRKDPYERYDSMVIKQSALHLADELWGVYPMQAVLDFAEAFYPDTSPKTILELGCGVGRWIGDLAQRYPNADCWGGDYSYQMLKQAYEFWVAGQEISIDLRDKGFLQVIKKRGLQSSNLQFGLAKAVDLPFADGTQDLIISSFLLERLDDLNAGLGEMHRVLNTNGRLILVTPLNFNQAEHWKQYYPAHKLSDVLIQLGFEIQAWQENIIVDEPLDARGNAVRWNCLGIVADR